MLKVLGFHDPASDAGVVLALAEAWFLGSSQMTV
jgi:hypothetical protein